MPKECVASSWKQNSQPRELHWSSISSGDLSLIRGGSLGSLFAVSLVFIELKHFIAVYFPFILTLNSFLPWGHEVGQNHKRPKLEKGQVAECIKSLFIWILCALLNWVGRNVKSAVKSERP